MNGILGTLELLLEGELSGEARELALAAYESAHSLHRVFEDEVESVQSAELLTRPLAG